MHPALFIPTAFAALYALFCLVTLPGTRWMRMALIGACLWLATMALYGLGAWAGVVS